jgi:hypothetical protein
MEALRHPKLVSLNIILTWGKFGCGPLSAGSNFLLQRGFPVRRFLVKGRKVRIEDED